MKKVLLATVTAVVLGLGLSGAVIAKDGYKQGKGHNPVERMASVLDLSEEQISELETIYESHRETRQNMHEQLQGQIDSILTAEQLETKAEMMEKREGMQGHHKGKYRNGGCDS